MKLAYWMYAGPAHIGTLRVISSFKNVHAIMHAPLGDDYFNVMRSMLQRERDFTSVTASIVDRHVLARGSQEKVVENITRKDKEEQPNLIVLTPTCTSSILQEDLQNFVNSAAQKSDCDVLLADVNHYRINEFQAADRTLEQIVRFYIQKIQRCDTANFTEKPSANIIGIFTLGFHNQHDCRELTRLLNDLGIEINQVIPEGGNVKDLKNLTRAWFNIVPYREVGLMAANFLEKEYGIPSTSTTPMGIKNTEEFIREMFQIIKAHILSRIHPLMTPSLFSFDSTPEGIMSLLNSGILTKKPTGWAANQKNKINDPHCWDDWREELKKNEEKEEFHPFIKYKKVSMDMTDKQKKSLSGSSFLDREKKDMKEINTYFERFENYIAQHSNFVSQASWFSRSIDCQNLTGKKAVVFGDATHAASITKILVQEMGVRVICAGTYCKHDADWFRENVVNLCDQILITDDHNQVGDMIARIEPAAIFGTQMERHIGKRLDIPCGVISSPVHIQNFTLGYRPFLGYEGTNQISDLIYNSFTLGMEDHLLEIFGGHDTKESITKTVSTEKDEKDEKDCIWTQEALVELKKVPGFARGKAKRNTEKFAKYHNFSDITVEVIHAAKENPINE